MDKNIKKLKEQYQEILKQGILDYEKFNNYALTHHSTRIEGSSLSRQETFLLLDENLTPKGKPMEHSYMVLDHFKALKYVLELAENKTPLTAKNLQKISSLIMSQTGGEVNSLAGSFDSSKGEYRKLTVFAGETTFPSYQKVPKMVDEILAYVNEKNQEDLTEKQVYDLSFEAHYELVSIHPFADGNGRLSRLIMNYIQQFHNQPISVIFPEDKAEYIESLEKTDKTEDLTYFNSFMYKQLEKFFSLEIEKLTEKKKTLLIKKRKQ